MITEASLIQILLSALAVFRLAELFVYDEGPFGILAYLRGWVLLSNHFLRTIGQALSCVYCIGIYLAALAAVPLFFQSLYLGFLSLFAIAGLQSVLAHHFGRESV